MATHPTSKRLGHTPGPWRPFKSHVANPWWTIAAGERGCVAELEGGHITAYNDPDHPEAVQANALLIAAAPDLLALARKIAGKCAECGGSAEKVRGNGPDPRDKYAEPCAGCADIWAVIDKAEGRV